jgi:6-pyruvoyltetrahydropterin/6-carboxytetrahydropterin synthase
MKSGSMFELRKTLQFEAAHLLPDVPSGHKCGRLHGHSYRVTIVVRGELNEKVGWVVDYADIKRVAGPVIALLDHYYLNDIPGLSKPTAEVLARWIFEKLKSKLPGLFQIIVGETCTSESRYQEGPLTSDESLPISPDQPQIP